MQKVKIKNRSGKKIVVLIEKVLKSKGLVFIMHGLGGTKDHPRIISISDAFKKNNYNVVRFDTTNSIGESDGKLENATPTNYYHDLEDVIKWAKVQKWYQEPFILTAHSLGGFCIFLYAINHPKKVNAIIPVSCVVPGKLMFQSKEFKPLMKEWKKKGIREWESKSQSGLIKRLKYSFVEDALRYDLLKMANRIACPVLLIGGDSDTVAAPEHIRLLFKKLKTEKELHILKNTDHDFKSKRELKNLKQVMKKWLKKINSIYLANFCLFA